MLEHSHLPWENTVHSLYNYACSLSHSHTIIPNFLQQVPIDMVMCWVSRDGI